jgi:hypothetical protein
LLGLHGRYHQLYTKQHGFEQNLFLSAREDDRLQVMVTDELTTEPGGKLGNYSGSVRNDGRFSTTRT